MTSTVNRIAAQPRLDHPITILYLENTPKTGTYTPHIYTHTHMSKTKKIRKREKHERGEKIRFRPAREFVIRDNWLFLSFYSASQNQS